MPSSRSDRDFLKELKRKDKKRRKLKKRRRHRSESSSDSSDSEGSDLDLGKEMFPISHYVNDREEMIAQVFSVIKGDKLRSMLPPFLADLDIEEVKALCLEQVTWVWGLGLDNNCIKFKNITSCCSGLCRMSLCCCHLHSQSCSTLYQW